MAVLVTLDYPGMTEEQFRSVAHQAGTARQLVPGHYSSRDSTSWASNRRVQKSGRSQRCRPRSDTPVWAHPRAGSDHQCPGPCTVGLTAGAWIAAGDGWGAGGCGGGGWTAAGVGVGDGCGGGGADAATAVAAGRLTTVVRGNDIEIVTLVTDGAGEYCIGATG
jgi:hypothetical protein